MCTDVDEAETNDVPRESCPSDRPSILSMSWLEAVLRARSLAAACLSLCVASSRSWTV